MDRDFGYTLLEAVATLTVALVVLSVGVPGFTRLVAVNQRSVAANELLGTLQAARLEAAKRHVDIAVCPNDGHGRCAGVAGPWPHGYLVFVTNPPGPPYQIARPADLLASKPAPKGVTLLANRDAFAMRPLAWRSRNGTVRVCPHHERVAPRAVIVSVAGRPRVSSRLPSGAPIPCPPV